MRRAAGFGTRVDTALLALCVLLALILKASGDPLREGFASFLRQTILAPAFSLQASSEKWRSALTSHDELLASRDSAILRALEVPKLEAENARLAQLLVLGSRIKWGFVPARVLYDGNPASGATQSVTIAAGSEAGIKPRSPVITVEGLVGIVKSVEKATSTVSLWTSPEFATGAMAEDGSAFGIVSPHLVKGSYLLIMRDVAFRYVLKEGTPIVASGQGGVYPAMTPIGTVIKELVTESGMARSYLVQPHVRPQSIETVMVLDPARAAAGAKDVWLTTAQVDSVRRAVDARSDSIKRLEEAKAAAALLPAVGSGGGGER